VLEPAGLRQGHVKGNGALRKGISMLPHVKLPVC